MNPIPASFSFVSLDFSVQIDFLNGWTPAIEKKSKILDCFRLASIFSKIVGTFPALCKPLPPEHLHGFGAEVVDQVDGDATENRLQKRA